VRLASDLLTVNLLSRGGVNHFYQVLTLEFHGHVSVRSILRLVSLYIWVEAIEHETTRHHVSYLEASPDRLADRVIAWDIRHGSAGIGHAVVSASNELASGGSSASELDVREARRSRGTVSTPGSASSSSSSIRCNACAKSPRNCFLYAGVPATSPSLLRASVIVLSVSALSISR
jgi:hypothetical protein